MKATITMTNKELHILYDASNIIEQYGKIFAGIHYDSNCGGSYLNLAEEIRELVNKQTEEQNRIEEYKKGETK